ncbi:MAG: diguanylate cyclase [Gammaproteobacteria bacterium]
MAGSPGTDGALVPALRLAAMLSALTVTLVVAAALCGLVTDGLALRAAARARQLDLVAHDVRQFGVTGDEVGLGRLLKHLVDSDFAVGAYARRDDGGLLAIAGEIDLTRKGRPEDPDFATIDLVGPSGAWGRVGLELTPLGGDGLPGALAHPLVPLTLFIGLGSFVCFTFYLRRVLSSQDPAAVMPDRVRTVMNGLVEGVVLLDVYQRIVHCNWAFARNFDVPAEALRGRVLSSLEWGSLRPEQAALGLPWDIALKTGKTQVDANVVLTSTKHGRRIYSVNVTPMFDAKRQVRGALATFDDQTTVFAKNAELRRALAKLDRQRNEIAKQNEELKGLATRDSLTGCLNRRAFLEIFEAELLAAQKRGYHLACVMCDIDRFKSINDAHGHTIGDRVIEQVARLLAAAVRDNDHICRYGGEEFCVLLPGLSSTEAATIAERMRLAIEQQMTTLVPLPETPVVTASFGITDLQRGAQSLSELIDQADAALYRSKEGGRNRVTLCPLPGNVRQLSDLRPRS